MIPPTVGRVVLYHPSTNDPGGNIPGGPLAAIIARVHSDTLVNLMVISPDGSPFGRTSVCLLQSDEQRARHQTGPYCEWMPYQKGQAAKTEALEKQLGAA